MSNEAMGNTQGILTQKHKKKPSTKNILSVISVDRVKEP